VHFWKQHSDDWNRSVELSKILCPELRQGGRTYSLLVLLYVFCSVACSQGRCLECVRAVCVCVCVCETVHGRSLANQEGWVGHVSRDCSGGPCRTAELDNTQCQCRFHEFEGTEQVLIIRSYVSGHLLDPLCWQASSLNKCISKCTWKNHTYMYMFLFRLIFTVSEAYCYSVGSAGVSSIQRKVLPVVKGISGAFQWTRTTQYPPLCPSSLVQHQVYNEPQW
jgi:hypothetical protein